ncbi:unnamed protein product [Spirodela intermedia]|uniref:Uncharacterized protein n=1 Tax=Spirodela intermedia TaxID=51605 RepID=A0A7I8KP98_SPIIN|nr:unnamed protein product [Spirodela intermedia]
MGASPPGKPPPRPSGEALPLLLFQTFEESLVCKLKSLNPTSSGNGGGEGPAASFPYLSRAVGVLSSAHRLLESLFSDPFLSGSDEAAVAAYLGDSLRLLDLCNSLSEEIQRLRRGRLLLLFAVQLLSSPTPTKVRKAREVLNQWEGSSSGRLVLRLTRREAPVTPLGRAVYAVEAVSALVAGFWVSSLGGGAAHLAAVAEVPREFPWAKAFNELRAAALSCSVGGWPAEGVDAAVRRLSQIITEPAREEEQLRSSVKELARATEGLTEGLDSLGGAAESLFRGVLRVRNTALQGYRLLPKKCSIK